MSKSNAAGFGVEHNFLLKNRTLLSEKNPNFDRIKPGDSIKVKSGIMDPDTGKYDLSGWQGRVTDVYEEPGEERILCIQWDKQTLQEMPKTFIRESIADGYEYAEMNLGESEVELSDSRDTVEERTALANALEEENYWVDFGDQGDRIKKILDACPYEDFDIMTHWFEHLENTIELPVRLKYVGDSNQNLRNGAEILLNSFVDADDEYGVIASARYDRRWGVHCESSMREKRRWPGGLMRWGCGKMREVPT